MLACHRKRAEIWIVCDSGVEELMFVYSTDEA